MATNYYESFIKKLQEIFMMDHAELDFGIYRIMNQKRTDINHFLKFELLPQVKTALADAPDGSENEVFSHLVTFFSRYYDNGDFISKRRYKDNTYAIPYNGEEVKLHWANADQYYIKSSEYFRDYSFVLPTSRRKVHFVLKDASTEQNNNKTANNMERRFALYKPETEGESFYEVNGDELSIFFTYELMPKGTKQNDLMAEAFDSVKDIIPLNFSELLTVKSPTDKNAYRTLLEKHLTDYTAKNSFDYFIHKDLGGFLRRELDFYIKNEVMLLDDLDVKHIESQLNIIKAIKLVGEKIIRMLAQLEDFQKKLWLKKKFVVQSDYCITIDRVPRKLYPEILANDRQREEWVRLFAIDEIKGDLTTEAYSVPLTMEFLEQNPFLVLDTAFFSKQFKHKLVASMENVDKDCNGLLINSENFQTLELLQEKYKKGIKCIYIDPPYNTNASEIIYKNGYKHSSWNSLLYDRLTIADNLVDSLGFRITAIDHAECFNLGKIQDYIYGEDNRLAIVSVQHNPKGRNQAKFFSENIEYLFFYAKDAVKSDFRQVAISDDVLATFTLSDENGKYRYENYIRARTVWSHANRPDNWYPIYVSQDLKDITSDYHEGYYELYPITDQGEFSWKNVKETFDELNKKKGYFIATKDNGKIILQHKYYEQEVLKNLWIDKKYQSEFNGTNVLKAMIPNNGFDYPKSIYAVEDCIKLCAEKKDVVLDYFGGSGTTAHSVINLNKKDNGSRYFILVEMGHHFDTVLRPRVEKVVYSEDWDNGKPVSRNGISQCFKYMRLEQYEDTLNNLKIKEQQTTAQFNEGSGFKESYMLEYMLDVETRDSLLNLKMFENPFAMTLKTTKDNELVDTEVDMVETFNYLIGLNVETEDWYRDENICVVQGYTHRDNLHTLVIWRNCKEIDNEQLNQFFERMNFRTRDSEFDLIYVNGDNLLPNLRRDEDNWKVVLIEEEFTKRMFETE
ncbi:MAG: site-specific DNA-methyltransferase [Prevotella sp.]|nr:site-specific DNA-methyltransferase [Prevotella sp.]